MINFISSQVIMKEKVVASVEIPLNYIEFGSYRPEEISLEGVSYPVFIVDYVLENYDRSPIILYKGEYYVLEDFTSWTYRHKADLLKGSYEKRKQYTIYEEPENQFLWWVTIYNEDFRIERVGDVYDFKSLLQAKIFDGKALVEVYPEVRYYE